MAEEDTIWELKPHTRVKHQILRSYLDAWFPILGGPRALSKRLLFIDGFAGPGVYRDGEPGSPIVALNAIANTAIDLSGCNFVFLFVEENADRVASLNAEIERFWESHDVMPNVRTYVEHGTFADVATEILGRLEAEGARLAPTLAMVDPFGFKGVPMSLISEFLRFPRCEILFNFMLDSVNRHAQNPKVREHMQALFGCDDFMAAPPGGDTDRQPYLVDLYGRQLRQSAEFDHVSRFELVNERGRNNVLFHGTRHLKGLEVMRRISWGVDPVLGRRFDARDDPSAGTLFGGEPDLEQLRTKVAMEFAGRTVSPTQIFEFVLKETDFDPTRHLKKETLKVLENEGWIIEVIKPDGTRRSKGTFPDGCRITFDGF